MTEGARVTLVRPSMAALPQYVDALKRGFYPDNTRGRLGADEQLARISEDAAGFVALQDDPEAKGPPIRLICLPDFAQRGTSSSNVQTR